MTEKRDETPNKIDKQIKWLRDFQVGMIKLAPKVWAVFSADLIRIIKVKKESVDAFDLLEDGNCQTYFVEYAE